MRKIENTYYEDFMREKRQAEEARRAAGQKNKKKRKKKLGGGAIAAIITGAVLVVAALLAVTYVTVDNYVFEPQRQRDAYMEAYRSSQVFMDGVEVDGVDISGLSPEQAKERIEEKHANDPFEDIKFTLALSADAKRTTEEAKAAKAAELKALEAETAETMKDIENSEGGVADDGLEEGETGDDASPVF